MQEDTEDHKYTEVRAETIPSKRIISRGNRHGKQPFEERLPLQHGIKRACSSDDQSTTKRFMKDRSEPPPNRSQNFSVALPSFEYSNAKSGAERRSPSTQPIAKRAPVSSTHILPQTTMESLVSPPPSGSAGFGTAAPSATLRQPTNFLPSKMESPDTKDGAGPNRSSGSPVGLSDALALASSETMDFPSSCTFDHEEDDTVCRNEADEYGFDDGLEQDMLQLSNIINSNDGDQLPPSSVMQDWDRDSRSREEYDPTLQHSSRQPSPEVENVSQAGERSDPDPEAADLLDDDVDWDAVYSIVKDLPRDPSLLGSEKMRPSMLRTSTRQSPAAFSGNPGFNEVALQPFTRPPFPEKVSDEPSIPGASNNTVLRTCFRIGHMISLASQDAVFDFFARVMYSARENLAIKQHFQFADLFKDQHPYPSGTLAGWRVGGRLDRESYVFISTRQPKLCRCLGKMKRDQKASSGWSIEIMAIRQVTWEDIESAKAALSGVMAEDGRPLTAAKL